MADQFKQMKQEEKPQPPPTTMNTDIDRISNLPDPVLCHILSFLPTRTSVTTSILSRRWRHLWQHLDVFHFDERHFRDHRTFSRFMNAVLAMRMCKVRDIKKFHLRCDVSYTDRYDAMKWVRAAIGPHLKELNLDIFSLDRHYSSFPEYVLTCRTVFSCPALVSLNLRGGISFDPNSYVHLPSLKNLTLHGTYPIDVLLSGCPVLETLVFFGASSTDRCCIISSSLKSLVFHFREHDIKNLVIHTPSLEYISIDIEDGCEQLSICSLLKLERARLDFSYMALNVDIAQQFLMALSRTKTLRLDNLIPKILCRDGSILNFPKFSCLLKLTIDTRRFHFQDCLELLHNCKILQDLKIYHAFKEGSYYSNDSSCNLSKCLQQANIPECVMFHLTTVVFKGFQASEDERAFVKYILHRGLVLKTMEVDTVYIDDYHSLKYLSTISRGSNVCQLRFNNILS